MTIPKAGCNVNGAVINNLSLVALGPLPVVPACSISKTAASSMTQ